MHIDPKGKKVKARCDWDRVNSLFSHAWCQYSRFRQGERDELSLPARVQVLCKLDPAMRKLRIEEENLAETSFLQGPLLASPNSLLDVVLLSVSGQ